MGMFDDIPIAEPPKAGGMFDDIPVAKPNSPLQNAIEPVTSYPAEYTKERKGSEDLMQSGYEDYSKRDLTKPGWLDPVRSLIAAGKMGAGALGYVSSPVTAGLNTVVGNPVEKISGSPFAGKMASAAAGALIPGYGYTKMPFKPVPTVAPPVVSAVQEARDALARTNAAKAREFTDTQGRSMELSHGEASQDPSAMKYEDMAGREAFGKEAQDIAVPIQNERFDVMHGAAQKIGEDLNPESGLKSPQEAAQVIDAEVRGHAQRAAQIRDELAQHAAGEEQAQRQMLTDRERSLGDIVQGQHGAVTDPRDAGEIVGQGVRQAAQQARQNSTRLYDEAFSREGQFHAATFEGVGQRIKSDLTNHADPVIVDDITTPITSRALQHIDSGASRLNIQNRADPMGPPGQENIVGVDLRGVDQVRKQLMMMYRAARGGANPADARAMGRVIEAFDDQIERAVSSNLFSGDPRALQALRDARASYRQYAQTFRPQGAGDEVGQFMRRVIDRNATPEDVARGLVGSGTLGSTGAPVQIARRLAQVFGRDSQEWSAIRQALWHQASQVERRGVVDPAASARNLQKFSNSTLAREVFSPEELAVFRSHAQSVHDLQQTLSVMPERAMSERAAADYQRRFGADADVGGGQQRLLRRIVDGSARPDEIVAKVFDAANAKDSSNAWRFVRSIRDIAGHDSPAFQAIRQGVWQRLTAVAPGADRAGAQKLSNAIFKFLEKDTAKQLYSSQERALMQRYAEVVKLKQQTWASKTNSGTTPALMAVLSKLGPHIGKLAGTHLGGLPGYGIGHAVDKMLESARAAGHARDVENSLKPGYRRGGVVNTRAESRYRSNGGTTGRHCGICAHFRAPKSCTEVSGVIASGGVCDWFKVGRSYGGRAMADGGVPDDVQPEVYLDQPQTIGTHHEPSYAESEASQEAAEAAAARVKAPYAKANARESGLPQVLDYYGNKITSALTAPRDALTGAMPVTDTEGMPTPEAMQRAKDVANLAMTGGMPMAQEGALGMAGGKLHASDPLASLREAGMQAAQPGIKASLPPPKKLLDRTWDNYTKRMTEEEALQSEPVWGAAQRMADDYGTSHASAFARVMNDWYKRKGVDKYMSEEAANAYTGVERANAQFGDLLKHRSSKTTERAAGGRVHVDRNPTLAQIEAGNYRKGHVSIQGLPITIENPRGSERSGIGKDGKRWAVTMPAHYGYFKGTVGKDKDHVDCYIGPHTMCKKVFIVDQKDAEAGKFDEHKCMIGFNSEEQARKCYIRGFSDGKGEKRIGHITEMSMDSFKHWLREGNTTSPARVA